MAAGLDLILSFGLGQIESRILALGDLLIEGLRARGCLITTPIARRSERSGIICFRHPKVDSTTLAQRLHEADVVVSLRGDVIRVSPHFYNSSDDLERLFRALPPYYGLRSCDLEPGCA
jgi:selenocysteine lyase/cysteine desulfurase